MFDIYKIGLLALSVSQPSIILFISAEDFRRVKIFFNIFFFQLEELFEINKATTSTIIEN